MVHSQFHGLRGRAPRQCTAYTLLSIVLLLAPTQAELNNTIFVNLEVATIEELVATVQDVSNLNAYITLTAAECAPIISDAFTLADLCASARLALLEHDRCTPRMIVSL